jgi:phospholipid-binding lipoprotein MlaA
MKRFTSLILIAALLIIGCAHNSNRTASAQQTANISLPPQDTKAVVGTTETQDKQAETSPATASKSKSDDEYLDDNNDQEVITIADPIEPFNRAMYVFNDKLYYWMLKPVAQGYSKVVPEPARISVNNFFTNLGFPLRFVSFVLQADFGSAATEVGRFGINTLWGIGGLMDPAAGGEINLPKQDTDLGLTLGYYGVGHGFYIVWPVLGPSSPRDSVDIVGEYFLYPVSYLNPWYSVWLPVKSFEVVNSTSLSIGDYESLQQAAIDPYVAVRDAYIQYRFKKIKGKNQQPAAETNKENTKENSNDKK